MFRLALVSAVVFWAAAPSFVAAEDEGDIDLQLLDELESDLDDDLLGDAPQDNPNRAGAVESRPDAAETPSKTDEELFEKLDVDDLGDKLGEDVAGGADETVLVDQLGENVDPLTRIGHKMRRAEGLLPSKAEIARTKNVQDEIVKDLEELIKQLQKQKQQSSSQSKSQGRQQASRSKIQQPGQQPSRSKPGDRESKQPATDSEERQGTPKEAQVDLAQLEEVIKEIWGHLPERERERLRQLFREEEPISNHELAIEKYFRRMSEAEDN